MKTLDTISPFRGASLVGMKYNRLTVERYAGKTHRLDVFWECRCDCGSLVTVWSRNLKNGNTKSCGCLNRELHSQCLPLEERRQTFWSNVEKLPSGCWEWTSLSSNDGYGLFCYNKRGILAHRFSWFLTHGAWPSKPYVCHHCDNPKCVNPDHLFEGTAHDNNHDAITKGRVRHWGCPKITPQQVREIRTLYGSGQFTYTSLAQHLQLPRTQIFSALNKWKTLPLYAS